MKRAIILLGIGAAFILHTSATLPEHRNMRFAVADTAADTETKTINLFNSLYAGYLKQPEAKKEAYLTESKNKIENYIKDDLKHEIVEWQATVLRNEPQEHAVSEVELYIQLRSRNDVKSPEFNSFVMRAFVKTSDVYVTQQLEDIREKDTVLFSGTIEQYKDYPACDSYSGAKEGFLNNPAVYIKLNDIMRLNK